MSAVGLPQGTLRLANSRIGTAAGVDVRSERLRQGGAHEKRPFKTCHPVTAVIRMLTCDASPILVQPEVDQLSSARQGVHHFQTGYTYNAYEMTNT